MIAMAQHKRPAGQPPGPDRHRPRTMVGIPEELADQLRILARNNLTKVSQEAVRLILEGLRREGLWPPREDPK